MDRTSSSFCDCDCCDFASGASGAVEISASGLISWKCYAYLSLSLS